MQYGLNSIYQEVQSQGLEHGYLEHHEEWSFRSSHQGCSIKKDVLKNSAKFTGKQMCQSLFLNKVAGIRPATLIRKRLWHSCFPVNFAKYLRTPFLQNTPGRLLLVIAALRLYEIVQVSLFLLT